ncbi:unnamed protein product [Peniophora sp. CBMAI 1063]|nr:unnamed protein product [Peniophora sp. CBMAI 1063]
MNTFTTLTLVAALAVSNVAAFTINFKNNCDEPVWAAVGAAPNGVPNPSIAYGKELAPGASSSYGVSDTALGIRAWGRTGCDANGANCATGNCNGGLVCTDGGITVGVILSEYGYGDFGANFGGQRTAWDLSHVDSSINLDTQLTDGAGQTVTCTLANCPADQAYDSATDYAADRNSALGASFTHTFCP